MILQVENGPSIAGYFDVLCILRHAETKKYHPAIMVERPFHGPVPEPEHQSCIRLRSQGHFPGFDTLGEATAKVAEIREKITFDDSNVWTHAVGEDWDGGGFTVVIGNWRRG